MNSISIGLVGNPNSGKTTVFNALTGSKQHVGNWPGVTVERKSGFFQHEQTRVEVIDLPGIYSLTVVSDQSSIDEKIACHSILSREADLIVNILDASHLERSLYLTMQLIEMQVPVVLAINMMDVAKDQGIYISANELEKRLGCPVVFLEANRGKGIKELQKIVSQKILPPSISYPRHPALTNVLQEVSFNWMAIRLLENDVYIRDHVSDEIAARIPHYQQMIREQAGEDADILLADARYRFIGDVLKEIVHKTKRIRTTITEQIDRVILNRWLGIPIFLAVMYSMFLFSINVGGAFQDFFDMSSSTIFVDGVNALLTKWHAPDWLIALLANGVGKGINTTLTFIPVIGAMFLFLAFLEDSGYMARASFVVDRLMRALGLPGKSFVPMIVGFGCNVPGVMAARTLENKRDRILTIMMSPFMSCGARLAIYAVFVAAFFPKGGQNVIFALYLIGIMAAMLTGLLLRKTLLQGEPAPLLMELPVYHIPRLKTLLLHAWHRLEGFVFRAGKLIIPICILLGVLNSITLSGGINNGDADVNSLLSWLGKSLTPVFSPMGIHSENWPATVGLLTGILAKEVVIGTLNALYSQLHHVADLQINDFHFWGGLYDAFASIPANLSQLGNALAHPISAQAPIHSLSQTVYGEMYQRFGSPISAMAYLLFVLLYIPCVSTLAAMVRELHRGWAIFSLFWSTGLAYGVAVIFYQAATFLKHPWPSFSWIAGIGVIFLSVILVIQWIANRSIGRVDYEFT